MVVANLDADVSAAAERGWLRVAATDTALRTAWLERCKVDGRPCVHVLTRRKKGSTGERVSITMDLTPSPHLRFDAATRERVERFAKDYVIARSGVTVAHSTVLLPEVATEKADAAAAALLKAAELLGAA
jgi:hypothetical protein